MLAQTSSDKSLAQHRIGSAYYTPTLPESPSGAAPEPGNSVQAHFRNLENDPNHQHFNALVEHFMHLVAPIARRVAYRCLENAAFQPEDLAQQGIFGLFRAISAFQPERNVQFEVYASKFIRGAMIDFVREQSHAPREIVEAAGKIKSLQDAAFVAGKRLTPEEIEESLVPPPADSKRGQVTHANAIKLARSCKSGIAVVVTGLDSIVNSQSEADQDSKSQEPQKEIFSPMPDPAQTAESVEFILKIARDLSAEEKYLFFNRICLDATFEKLARDMNRSASGVALIYGNALKSVMERITYLSPQRDLKGHPVIPPLSPEAWEIAMQRIDCRLVTK